MTKRTVEYFVLIFCRRWQVYAGNIECIKCAREWEQLAKKDGFKTRIRRRECITIAKERIVK